MTAIRSVVLGCGSYLPQKVLTNAELAARIDTSDEWIVQRTGIRQRHVAADDEFTSHLNRDLADRVREGLRAARPRVTIIESTHMLDAVRADQVVRLDAGRLVSA